MLVYINLYIYLSFGIHQLIAAIIGVEERTGVHSQFAHGPFRVKTVYNLVHVHYLLFLFIRDCCNLCLSQAWLHSPFAIASFLILIAIFKARASVSANTFETNNP
ncbi:hypothetical protein SAMN04487898_115155 [Pedobacter sp. ok626]|nr:hypothetical protein SAMN04487898_115155 [Pedobacter sp. ok626]